MNLLAPRPRSSGIEPAKWLAILVYGGLAAGCGKAQVPQVDLHVHIAGNAFKDPLHNPGTATQPESDVDLFSIEADNATSGATSKAQVTNDFAVSQSIDAGKLSTTPGPGWQVTLTGLDHYGNLYSVGRSPQFTVPSKGSVDVTLLFGIADDFAASGTVTGGLGAFASANALPDGSVLLIGLGGVFLHTPATGQTCSSDCLGNSPPPRFLHAAVSLSNGNVFVAGGEDASGKFLSDAYVFDGKAKSFGPALSLSGLPPRAGSAAALLAGDKVLLAGGLAASAGDTSRVIVVDVNGGSATASSSPLAKGVYLATATALTTGEILVAGGLDSTGAPVSDSAVYSGDGSSATPGPALLTARGAHTATQVPDGHVFIYGGVGSGGAAIGAPEAYVPLTGQFEPVDGQTTASVIDPRAGHVAVLLDAGDVLVFGGEPDVVGPPDPARAVAAVRFTPSADASGKYLGTFASIGTSLVRTGAAAAVLPDASVLVAGGTQPALGSGLPTTGSSADWLSSVDLYVPCALKARPCSR